jgi:protein-L-isoaspartate(D-aspartate) O-methyltransferase
MKKVRPIVVLLAMLLLHTVSHANPETSDQKDARDLMVRIQVGGSLFGREPVRDKAVLDAMRKVPRHAFVPEPYTKDAYRDEPLPIGYEQTISQPYIVGFMTEALRPEAGQTVLEIGTGSGYQAAVLAEIVDTVYTIEIVPELGEWATKTLNALGYANVHTRVGDGYQGWQEHAPFDGIIVTAAPDHIPPRLLEQLKIGGRMVIPVGPEDKTQKLLVLTKQPDGSISREELMLVRFVPFTGEAQERRSLPDQDEESQ